LTENAALGADIRISDVIAHPLTQTLPQPTVTSWGKYSDVSICLVEVRTDAEKSATEALTRRERDLAMRSREAIDAAIAAWTATREAGAIEAELQARGIPAHAVLDMPGCYADAQLQARGHFVDLPHPIHGTVTIEGSRSRLSAVRWSRSRSSRR